MTNDQQSSILVCIFFILYIGFSLLQIPTENEVCETEVMGMVQDGRVSHRLRRQTSLSNYTLELLFVIDEAVFSWFDSLKETSKSMQKEGTKTLIIEHYIRIFDGMNSRYKNIADKNPNFHTELELVDIIIETNLTYQTLDNTRNGSQRGLIPAPEVLDVFLNWTNVTELPVYDHAILFTGYNVTYGGSASSKGLSFPDSVCTSQSLSVVEDSYDTRTIITASQELGRSLGSRLDLDGNFCRSSNLNIMSTKFEFNSPKIPNLWEFSRCSISYFEDFTKQLDRKGKNCLTIRNAISNKFASVNTPQLDADEQCKNAYGKTSFVCRALTGKDYTTICGGMFCFVAETVSCSKILPADGTICGNFSVCEKGLCLSSINGENRRDDCPFGDQPVLPNSVGCNTRIYSRPYDCYSSSFNAACCDSCENIKTDITGCEYGDRIENCNFSLCQTYDNFTRENRCCLTCTNGTSLIRSTAPITTAMVYTTTIIPVSSTGTEKVSKPTTEKTGDTKLSTLEPTKPTAIRTVSKEATTSDKVTYDNNFTTATNKMSRETTLVTRGTTASSTEVSTNLTIPFISTDSSRTISTTSSSTEIRSLSTKQDTPLSTVPKITTSNNLKISSTIEPETPSTSKAIATQSTANISTTTKISTSRSSTIPADSHDHEISDTDSSDSSNSEESESSSSSESSERSKSSESSEKSSSSEDSERNKSSVSSEKSSSSKSSERSSSSKSSKRSSSSKSSKRSSSSNSSEKSSSTKSSERSSSSGSWIFTNLHQSESHSFESLLQSNNYQGNSEQSVLPDTDVSYGNLSESAISSEDLSVSTNDSQSKSSERLSRMQGPQPYLSIGPVSTTIDSSLNSSSGSSLPTDAQGSHNNSSEKSLSDSSMQTDRIHQYNSSDGSFSTNVEDIVEILSDSLSQDNSQRKDESDKSTSADKDNSHTTSKLSAHDNSRTSRVIDKSIDSDNSLSNLSASKESRIIDNSSESDSSSTSNDS